jgi:2-polyprenyl-3-methyl-5-hydroxy-6-metoxy-1,4-benzoquinol methylase
MARRGRDRALGRARPHRGGHDDRDVGSLRISGILRLDRATQRGQPRDLLARSRAQLAEYRFAAEPLDKLCSSASGYAERAERHLARLHRALDADDARFDDAILAFIEMTVDVMRMQERYFRTGQFDAGPDLTGRGLYEDPDVMGRRYLLGLYLAQIFWPNHLEKVVYFENEFLGSAADGMRVLEVGTGPGTYGLAIGRAVACSELLLNDISPLSIDLVRRLAAVDPVLAPEALAFTTSDVLDVDPKELHPFDIVLFSEIVEHLPDPARGLEHLRSLLAPDASVFFSTATNAAFYDHTVVFETVDDIERLLRTHGFDIVKHHSVVAAPGPDGRDVVDYIAVLRRARTT